MNVLAMATTGHLRYTHATSFRRLVPRVKSFFYRVRRGLIGRGEGNDKENTSSVPQWQCSFTPAQKRGGKRNTNSHTHTRTHTDMQTHIHLYVDTHATDTNKYTTYQQKKKKRKKIDREAKARTSSYFVTIYGNTCSSDTTDLSRLGFMQSKQEGLLMTINMAMCIQALMKLLWCIFWGLLVAGSDNDTGTNQYI